MWANIFVTYTETNPPMTANGCRCIGDNKKQTDKQKTTITTTTTITLHSQENKTKSETKQNWNKNLNIYNF